MINTHKMLTIFSAALISPKYERCVIPHKDKYGWYLVSSHFTYYMRSNIFIFRKHNSSMYNVWK